MVYVNWLYFLFLQFFLTNFICSRCNGLLTFLIQPLSNYDNDVDNKYISVVFFGAILLSASQVE